MYTGLRAGVRELIVVQLGHEICSFRRFRLAWFNSERGTTCRGYTFDGKRLPAGIIEVLPSVFHAFTAFGVFTSTVLLFDEDTITMTYGAPFIQKTARSISGVLLGAGIALFLLFVHALPVSAQSSQAGTSEPKEQPAEQRPGGPGGRGGMQGGIVEGEVYDASTGEPVGYATVILFTLPDSSQATGMITDTDGRFRLTQVRPGRYFLDVTFIGYEHTRVDEITINRGNRTVDVGRLELQQATVDLEAVDYTITQAPMEYKIDRKVVRVSKQATAASGTAVDVLENVPSVSVDIEGNVSLRGSGNFTVLIDGRPTVLDANDVLQTTAASSIEDIEIITNPSAKYDPDGTAGIINIVLKKNQLPTNAGIFSVSGGYPQRYNADALYSMHFPGVKWTINGEAGSRNFTGTRFMERRTTDASDVTSVTLSDGDMDRGGYSNSLRSSLEFDIGERHWLAVGGRGGVYSRGREAEWDYEEYDISPESGATASEYYISLSDRERTAYYGSAYVDYQLTFPTEGHQLVARVNGSWSDSDEETDTELHSMSNVMQEGRRTTEAGPGWETELEVEYTHPLNENGRKFEAGYEAEIEENTEETGFYQYDITSGAYQFYPEFSNEVNYDEATQSVFGIWADMRGSFGYQLGVRGEYTYRLIKLPGTGAEYSVDQWDVFPTAHLTYQLPADRQLMASYSRRIDRPRSWYLEPFLTWMDAYNVRTGNPDLDAEFIDSYELGFTTPLLGFNYSTEAYYRVTHNHVERVRSIYEPNVTLHGIENVGTAEALGVELMLQGNVRRWWVLNLMGNLYNSRVEGEAAGQNFDNEAFSWNTRVNMTFKLRPTTKLQLSGIYNSPRVTSQGERDDFAVMNLAVEQSFMNKSLTAILQVRDVLQTMSHAELVETATLYDYHKFDVVSPLVSVTLRYNLNQYRERNRRNGNGGMDDGMGGEDGF
ncbi:TonB-dependent receptor [bacterium]|nr:TonB-dependent receptor [bacterium]